ncbi:substrate-binding domain-containing protein [Persicitalea jodogahamensis]|nr:substrate-binding domain-containing protein [Persicitalea jodogahamensis]
MKSITVLLLAVLLLFSCQQQQERQYVIGFSQCLDNDEWRRTMIREMERELSFHPNVSMITKSAGGNSTIQIAQIQELMDQKVDLLIVSPLEAQPPTPIIEKALDQGFPIVVVDRRTASQKYTAFVGAENLLVGQNAGIYANVLLNGQGTILEVGEGADTSPSLDRHRGFVEVLQKYPGLVLEESLIRDWTPQEYEEEIRNYLSQHRDIDLVFAQNDRMALQVFEICEELGLEKSIEIIGVDGLYGENEGLDLVDKGVLAATVLYPTGGEEAIEVAMDILNNRPYQKENLLFTTIVNGDNVRILKQQASKLIDQQANINRQSARLADLNETYSLQKNALYVTILLLLLVLIFGSVLFYLLREKQRSNKVLAVQNVAIREQKEEIERVSQQARQATEEKIRFYSYMSHEFKTPLSLILTPTEDLLDRKAFDRREVIPVLTLIRKNANRLLRLVEQILDLRRIDAGKMELAAETYDLVEFTRDIVQDFKMKAQKSRIDLQFVSPLTELPYTFDAEKLDKVLFNLLSNAFKYTPDGGLIHVSLLLANNEVEIKVVDNGEGMTKKDREQVFEIFYRAQQNTSLGSGLGLALSREFVQLHDGEIYVVSEKGKGTTFTVVLPHRSVVPSTGKSELPHFLRHSPEEFGTPNQYNDSQDNGEGASLIIVEDNPDLLQFLENKFSVNYQVRIAHSAEDGWEAILQTIPDLIISDVTLGGEDGFSLTQKIKKDFRTSHIPVILLTAKGGIESQIEGTRAGADAYLSKPFNQKLLEQKVRTLLDNRNLMRRRFSNEITDLDQVPTDERKFLLDFELLIEKHLKSPALSVETLSQEMGMSRTQLYRKITALTNKNVNEYIGEFKIKKAQQLLTDPLLNIAEVAYALGFSTPNYFSTFFKQKTGKTPSEWRNN